MVRVSARELEATSRFSQIYTELGIQNNIFLVCNKRSRPMLGAPPLVVSVANSQAHYSIQNTIYQHLSDHQPGQCHSVVESMR